MASSSSSAILSRQWSQLTASSETSTANGNGNSNGHPSPSRGNDSPTKPTTSTKRQQRSSSRREKLIFLGVVCSVLGIFHRFGVVFPTSTMNDYLPSQLQLAEQGEGEKVDSNIEYDPVMGRQLNREKEFNKNETTNTKTATITSAPLANTAATKPNTVTTNTSSPVSSDPHQHALLIPYRDRAFHLEKFLEYMRPYLQRHFPHDQFTVYVVEQFDSSLFNRGWLTNVGLSEIQKWAPQTSCITLHDVDLIPNGTSHVPYTSCQRPIHLARHMENWNWAIPYVQYCGGITALSLDHWRDINGMSNDYVGWGGEDDDLWHRLRLNGLLQSPQPNPKEFPRPVRPSGDGEGYFRTISQAEEHHTQKKEHDSKKTTQRMLEEMWRGSDRWQTEGWNDVYYLVKEAINITVFPKGALDMPEWANIHVDNSNSTDNATNTKEVTPMETTTTDEEEGPYTKPLGVGIDKVVHIKATSQRSRIPKNIDIENNEADATPQALPVLELVDIPYTGGDVLTKAAARANVVWGACHYYDPVVSNLTNDYDKDPLECSRAENSGDWRFGNLLETSYHQAQFPWHVSHHHWQTDPLEGSIRFAIVKNPYTRALDFYRTWYDHNNGDKLNSLTKAEYLEQREQPQELDQFLRRYLEQDPKQPWVAPSFMRGVVDMMPMYDIILSRADPHYIKHTLHYENLEAEWQKLASDFNYTDTGIDEQLRQVLKEKKDQETEAGTSWLTPDQLGPETLDVINLIYNNDFKFSTEYNQIAGARKQGGTDKHPRQKAHKQIIAKGPLELAPIPYTGATGSLTRMASRAGIVWGACHFDQFDLWECPQEGSGDFRDSQKVKMSGINDYQAPWHVPLKFWSTSPFADLDAKKVQRATAKTITVVRHPYDRAIAFYRHMHDRQHGHPNGHQPMLDEDALFDFSSVEIDDYLRQREDPERLNAFLQHHFTKSHHPHKPDGMVLIPQYKYTAQCHHVIKYESLVEGLNKHLSKYHDAGYRTLSMREIEEYETKRKNYTKSMENYSGPKMLGRDDLSDVTVKMINDIYLMDLQRWYRGEKRASTVNLTRFWNQPQLIPGQRKG